MTEADDKNVHQAVRIEDVGHEGDGVAHLSDGRAVFVPRTLPGEVVDIRVVEDSSEFVRAEVERWREESDDRREPDCPYFTKCGGCRYWHTSYEREFELKAGAAREVIERHYGGAVPEPDRHPASSDRRYRTRARFHRRRTSGAADSGVVGFFARASHELVEIEDCLIADEAVNEARRRVEGGLEDVGDVELLVETAGEGRAVVSIYPADAAPDEPPASLVAFAESLEEHPVIRGVRFVGEERISVGGDATVDGDQVLAEVPVESIRLPAGLFRQANAAMNDVLVEDVCRRFEGRASERILELFCGVGNFSFPLSKRVGSLLGVEIDGVAVEMGQTMAEFSGRTDLAFTEADLSDGIADLEEVEAYPFDSVLLDPPRGGAAEVCRDLADCDAERTVYVSCDPPALGRDLALLDKGNWEIRDVAMFDLFPRTSHVEVVVQLERSG